ncbi:MAG: hypothetical protein QM632_01495 [Micrococcaceae bacterium]
MILELLLLSGIVAAVSSRANQRQARRQFGLYDQNFNQTQPLTGAQQPGYFANAQQLALEEHNLRATIGTKNAQAANAIVQLDDSIRSGEEELNFAYAEFGKSATERFENALEEAKYQIAESYALRQRIDMQQYSSLSEANNYLDEIIGRCSEAQDLINNEKSVFDTLRAQSVNAEQSIHNLNEEVQEKKAQLSSSAALIDKMNSVYATASLQVIQDNVEQANGRIVFAEEKIEEAQALVNSGNKTAAVIKIRYAEQSLTQAQQLIDSVQRRSSDLQTAALTLNTSIAEATKELESAEKLAKTSKNSAQIETASEELQAVLSGIKADAENNSVAPFKATKKLDDARNKLSDACAEARDFETKKKRATETLDHAILVARSQISATEDFIMARRGAVGADARVKLAEAQKTLDTVAQYEQSDPVKALDLAQEADKLASEGGQLAKKDVDQFGVDNASQDQPTTGAILGGMLVDSLLNKNKNQRKNWDEQ